MLSNVPIPRSAGLRKKHASPRAILESNCLNGMKKKFVL